jgi:hypothetical protein
MGEVCETVRGFLILRILVLKNVVATAVLWSLWKIGNKASFDKVYPMDPNSIIYRISRILSYWVILQKKNLRNRQRVGARILLVVAF